MKLQTVSSPEVHVLVDELFSSEPTSLRIDVAFLYA